MGTNPIFGIVILEEPEESNFHVMGAKTRVKFSEVFLLDTLQRSQEAPDTKALNSQQIDTLVTLAYTEPCNWRNRVAEIEVRITKTQKPLLIMFLEIPNLQ